MDTGQSGLLGAISGLTAGTASTAGSPEEATIAAHCNHILFLLNFFVAYERGETPSPDWAGSWKVREVNDDEWQSLRESLQVAYNEVVTRLRKRDPWPDAAVGPAMLLLVHCAYHVGEIRQRLTWVG